MPKKPPVDWYYHRKNCVTCTKMQAYLDARDIEPRETVSANKVRFEPAEALALARQTQRLIAAKGKNVVEIDVKSADDDTLLKSLIGPSGKLRAPAIRQGDVLLIGFHDTAFAEFLG